jgi:hypothetical protein
MNKTKDKGIRLSYFYFILKKNKKSNFGQTRKKKRENQIKPPRSQL